ncbi:GNAT family N-acetyltransferase [Desulfosarcina sp. OttesenSCG-928-A07]|nr:GNAT family N-acetyltransferase [Desulfosarcina sp. OttesenSCG-928-G17]MDL2328630.1 GNAT family N-acetyltransferase [Desulfosarcina sp. OttesenSCG-928-A07]
MITLFSKKCKKQEGLSTPQQALSRIEPGMNIFIGTGVAEPRTLIKAIMASKDTNLQDLTLIQILSLGDAISLDALRSGKFRLKTFFSGWVASDAISSGDVDLIPSRFSTIPSLINNRQVPVDAAIFQITPPDENGLCSLGVSVDVSRQVMTRAKLIIGEVNPDVPRTGGDTFVHISEFSVLVESCDPLPLFPVLPVQPVFDRIAAHVASVIEDGSCLAFGTGPLYDALPAHLKNRKHLGIHTPFITDAVMELINSGAVSNRRKTTFRGKSLTSYALGSKDLMKWLDRNPIVEFQSIDKVFNPFEIGRNSRFITIFPARKVDLSGRIAMHIGKSSTLSGPGQAMDFFNGAEGSPGGFTIFALPSRNLNDERNIQVSIEAFPNLMNVPDSVNMIATEYGIASLSGRTLRERAQALIEIAHPDDRLALVEEAKARHIIYADQIFLKASCHLYPSELAEQHVFKNDTVVRFRAIKPSDEEEMRRLFYRFSDQSIYYRFFTPIRTMPHTRMQEYVNVDYQDTLSIVGLVGPPGQGRIIAEARFVRHQDKPYVDAAFVVDEAYQGMGIATHLYRMLAQLAHRRGIRGMTADVLATNQAMLRVFQKGGYPIRSRFEGGSYALTISFDADKEE